MAGLLRNLVTILRALLFGRRDLPADDTVTSWFRVTPFDVGMRRMKSDRYLQLVEAAQIDFLIRTGLVRPMLAKRYGFLNGAQQVRFLKSAPLFARVDVDSRIAYADTRWAYFIHTLSVNGEPSAKVWVKFKFKQGSRTIPPAELIGPCKVAKPAELQRWDEALPG